MYKIKLKSLNDIPEDLPVSCTGSQNYNYLQTTISYIYKINNNLLQGMFGHM